MTFLLASCRVRMRLSREPLHPPHLSGVPPRTHALRARPGPASVCSPLVGLVTLAGPQSAPSPGSCAPVRPSEDCQAHYAPPSDTPTAGCCSHSRLSLLRCRRARPPPSVPRRWVWKAVPTPRPPRPCQSSLGRFKLRSPRARGCGRAPSAAALSPWPFTPVSAPFLGGRAAPPASGRAVGPLLWAQGTWKPMSDD